MLFQDIRDYQILFLSLFLVLGIGTRDWTLRPELIGVAIATCLSMQWLLSTVVSGKAIAPPPPLLPSPPPPSLRSALITSLGLSLLLRAEYWTTMAMAAAVAIASKFVFKVGEKHFFNPANFGIISALLLTPDAWVSPGQWGEDWWYGLLFAGTGGMILHLVGRWDTTAAFLGSYAVLEAIRNVWLGWTWDVYCHRLMSGSLLLFALFMVTDPRSIPNARIGRVVWAVCIAILTFILRNYFFVSTAVFWALFALAPLTILLDVLWSAPRFSWTSSWFFLKTNNQQ
ncbi:MAG: RnfABCDGE type electron transport complex subunit D [Stigonema ocellatum SAG 48.90 = DSM 106950]|nr:RnfABCDGE type electron transport complex subunit D [Stigonema ocellatum SAG 48.90 = DSM 106950]